MKHDQTSSRPLTLSGYTGTGQVASRMYMIYLCLRAKRVRIMNFTLLDLMKPGKPVNTQLWGTNRWLACWTWLEWRWHFGSRWLACCLRMKEWWVYHRPSNSEGIADVDESSDAPRQNVDSWLLCFQKLEHDVVCKGTALTKNATSWNITKQNENIMKHNETWSNMMKHDQTSSRPLTLSGYTGTGQVASRMYMIYLCLRAKRVRIMNFTLLDLMKPGKPVNTKVWGTKERLGHLHVEFDLNDDDISEADGSLLADEGMMSLSSTIKFRRHCRCWWKFWRPQTECWLMASLLSEAGTWRCVQR